MDFTGSSTFTSPSGVELGMREALPAISVEPGVGCAQAIINGWLTGSEPSCDC